MIDKDARLSLQTLKVLRALLDNNCAPRYGFELMRTVGQHTGVLYPLLRRLKENGWVVCEREAIDPVTAGRPARSYYQLTAEGRQTARHILSEVSDQLRPPGEKNPK